MRFVNGWFEWNSGPKNADIWRMAPTDEGEVALWVHGSNLDRPGERVGFSCVVPAEDWARILTLALQRSSPVLPPGELALRADTIKRQQSAERMAEMVQVELGTVARAAGRD